MTWYYWVIIGLVLIIAEMFTAGFVLAVCGLAAIAAGVLAVMGFGTTVQLLGFAIITLILFVAVRPIMLRHFAGEGGKVKTNVDALIDREGIVVERIDTLGHTGRVKVGGEDWRAISGDDAVIELGAKVKVLKVDGAKLIVSPALKGA